MKRKKLILCGLAIIIGGGLSAYFLNQGVAAEIVEVTPHDVTDTFTEDGTVKQGDAINILSDVNGTVTHVLVKPNQYVKKGDTLAAIDCKDYQYQIKQHQSTINSYNAQIQDALHSETQDKTKISYSILQLKDQLAGLEASKKASDIKQVATNSPEEYINLLNLNLEACQNSYDLAKKNYDQLQALYDAGAASAHEVDTAKYECITAQTALTKAQTQYDSSTSQLNKLKSQGISSDQLNDKFYAFQDENLNANMDSIKTQIASLESQLNHDYSSDTVNRLKALIEGENTAISQLNEQVDDCNITASTSGYITELPVENLSQIQAGTVIATLKSDKQLTISADVLTTCEPYLKVGDSVQFTQKLKSEDLTFTGKIQEIYDFAKESTSALGLKEHRVEVVMIPDDPSIPLKDGYELEVTFMTYHQKDALSIPNSATFKINEQDYVYKLENNHTVLTPVEIAHKTNTESVITSGLQNDDQVIYNVNTEGLKEGTHIKPVIKS